jgi:hypothetical protein
VSFTWVKERLVTALKHHHSVTKQLVAAQRDYAEERQRLLSGAPFVNPTSGATERFLYSALGSTEREREAMFLIIFDEQYPGFRKQLQQLEDAASDSAHTLKLAQLEYDNYIYSLRLRELEAVPGGLRLEHDLEVSSKTSPDQTYSTESSEGIVK